jgi:hypothetical protein
LAFFFWRRICWHPPISPCLFILSFGTGTWQLIEPKDAMHGFYKEKFPWSMQSTGRCL